MFPMLRKLLGETLLDKPPLSLGNLGNDVKELKIN